MYFSNVFNKSNSIENYYKNCDDTVSRTHIIVNCNDLKTNESSILKNHHKNEEYIIWEITQEPFGLIMRNLSFSKNLLHDGCILFFQNRIDNLEILSNLYKYRTKIRLNCVMLLFFKHWKYTLIFLETTIFWLFSTFHLFVPSFGCAVEGILTLFVT